jgi:tetratricopeptide (TPR) repeat protein
MKHFVLGLLASTTILFGMIYMTIVNPTLFTDIFGINEVKISSSETEAVSTEQEEASTYQPSDNYIERIEKGDLLFEEGYYPLAAIEYRFATELAPELDEPFFKLGLTHYENEKYEEAISAFDQSILNNATNIEAQIALGKTFIAAEQFEKARGHFEKLDSADQATFYYRGILNAYFEKYDTAKEQFNQTISAGNSAVLTQNAQNFLNSIEEASLAEDSDPHYLRTLIGRSFAETNEPRLAIGVLYDILKEQPDYRDAWIIMGYAYLTIEQYIDSRDALLNALELDPTKGETRYFLGISYFGLDEYDSAITQFELALESGFEPKVQVYQKLGDAAILVGDYPKASTAYEAVLTLNSSDIELFIRPIWLNIDHLNNIERATELAEWAIVEHTESAMAYNLLGWAQTAQNDYESAEQNLNYSLILDSNLPAAHLNFGWWYEKQGNLEEAKESYKRAYTLEPDGSIGSLAAERYNTLIESELETVETQPEASSEISSSNENSSVFTTDVTLTIQ